MNAMKDMGKVSTLSRNAPLPSNPICFQRQCLTVMFVFDHWKHKPHLMHELRTIGSKVGMTWQWITSETVKGMIGDGVVSSGVQTFNICCDMGVVCGVNLVPDTSLSWAKDAMAEVVQ